MNELLRLKKYKNLLEKHQIWNTYTVNNLYLKLQNCFDKEEQYLKLYKDNFIKLKKNENFDLELANNILEELNHNMNDFGHHYHNAIDQIEKKFNRIAVLLVGHYSSFLKCNNNIRQFFATMSHQVDYYFVTWDKKTYAKNEIYEIEETKDIKAIFDKAIKGSLIVKSLEHEYYNDRGLQIWPALHEIINLTYLSKLAQELKFTYETNNGFNYEQVVEITPSMFINTENWQNYCGDKYICTDHDIVLNCEENKKILKHWYIRTNSTTNNLLSNRYEFFVNCFKKIRENDIEMKTNPYIMSLEKILYAYLHDSHYNILQQTDANFETTAVA